MFVICLSVRSQDGEGQVTTMENDVLLKAKLAVPVIQSSNDILMSPDGNSRSITVIKPCFCWSGNTEIPL